jgi:dienelactone hydrolase
MTTLTPLNIATYISKPADYPGTPAKLLLLLTGGTGVHSPNNQLQADKFAAEGFLVVMPDMFAGDAAPRETNKVTSPLSQTSTSPSTGAAGLPESTGSGGSIISQLKDRAVEAAKSFVLDMWLARQTPEAIFPRIQAVLEAVRDEYADAVAHGTGIYAVGYCLGGKYVLVLAGQSQNQASKGITDEENAPAVPKGPLIKAGAIAHAALVTREDFLNLSPKEGEGKANPAGVPLSLVVVENDPLFPAEVLEVGRKAFASSDTEHEVRVYEGVPHGFAVVGEYGDENIRRRQGEAFEQMLGWVKRH